MNETSLKTKINKSFLILFLLTLGFGLLSIYGMVNSSVSFVLMDFKTKRLTYLLAIVLFSVLIIELIVNKIIQIKVFEDLKYFDLVAENLSKGIYNINTEKNISTEARGIQNKFFLHIAELKNFENEFYSVSNKISVDGDIDARLDSNSFRGIYRRVALEFNYILNDLTDFMTKMSSLVNSYKNGFFEVPEEKFIGEKAVLASSVKSLKYEMENIDTELKLFMNSVENGNLNYTIDQSKFSGNWKDTITRLNTINNIVYEPIKESTAVLEFVSNGTFSEKVTGTYQGEFLKLKDTLNYSISELDVYVNHISDMICKITNKDLSFEVDKEYPGDLREIKDNVIDLVGFLNKVVTEIDDNSFKITSGANMIADFCSEISKNTNKNVETLDELVTSITNISEYTIHNALNAEKANTEAFNTKIVIEQGQNNLDEMILKMDEVIKSTDEISKILKTMDEIAFQTNIASINASIESARSGNDGRSFGTIAEEVKFLAEKNILVVQKTRSIIEKTMKQIIDSSSFAKENVDTLYIIEEKIKNISSLTEEVAIGSKSQAVSINEINASTYEFAKTSKANAKATNAEAKQLIEIINRAEAVKQMAEEFKFKDEKLAGRKKSNTKRERELKEVVNYKNSTLENRRKNISKRDENINQGRRNDTQKPTSVRKSSITASSSRAKEKVKEGTLSKNSIEKIVSFNNFKNIKRQREELPEPRTVLAKVSSEDSKIVASFDKRDYGKY